MSHYAGWSLLRRAGFATKFGIVPVGVTGAIADIGAPFSLWVIPIGFAVIALLAWLVLFYFPGARKRLQSFLSQSESVSGAYSEPFIPSAASAALLLACFAGVGVGWLSFSQREDGGFLGANLEIAREIQRITGIIEAQGKTIADIQVDTGRVADVLETGEAIEPRVTLSNLGIQWSAESFGEAVMLGDTRVVDLFLRGGMPAKNAFPGTGDFIKFLNDPDSATLERLSEESFELAPAICGPKAWDWGFPSRAALRLPESRKFYARVCNNQTTKDQLVKRLADYRRYLQEDIHKNASVESDREDCLRLLNSREGVQAALALGNPPKYDNNLTIDHPIERMAARLMPLVMRPGSTHQDIESRIPEFARLSCNEAFTVRAIDEERALLIEDYEAVLGLME